MRLSFDDFGVGYVLFKWIGVFLFGEFKIDCLFIKFLLVDMDEIKIVMVICFLVKELKLDVVGEGCEIEE